MQVQYPSIEIVKVPHHDYTTLIALHCLQQNNNPTCIPLCHWVKEKELYNEGANVNVQNVDILGKFFYSVHTHCTHKFVLPQVQILSSADCTCCCYFSPLQEHSQMF